MTVETNVFLPQDPQYVQQALTHVLLMDAVVGTLQSPGAIYAASKLSYFDKMKNESKSSPCLTELRCLELVLSDFRPVDICFMS